MKYQLQHLALATFALWLCGCASSSIEQSWKSPTHRDGPVQKISILAVDERSTVRQGFENRFVLELRRNGQDSLATHELLGLSEIKADKEAAAARLRAAGAEEVLIIRLVDHTTYSSEVRATPELYAPTLSGAYESYNWHDYYSVAFMHMGVVWGNTKQNVYLDSSLFDLKTGQRLWSAVTLTELKEDADRLAAADSLVAKLVGALRKDGMVR